MPCSHASCCMLKRPCAVGDICVEPAVQPLVPFFKISQGWVDRSQIYVYCREWEIYASAGPPFAAFRALTTSADTPHQRITHPHSPFHFPSSHLLSNGMKIPGETLASLFSFSFPFCYDMTTPPLVANSLFASAEDTPQHLHDTREDRWSRRSSRSWPR